MTAMMSKHAIKLAVKKASQKQQFGFSIQYHRPFVFTCTPVISLQVTHVFIKTVSSSTNVTFTNTAVTFALTQNDC